MERTREGKRVARTKEDFREGRPKKYSKAQISHAITLLQDHSYKQVKEMMGISRATLVRAKKRHLWRMIKGDIYMAKGVLYIMTTVVDGLIKIGKTQTTQYENRMKLLESNGYRNITGLKRKFAIEVDEYDEKELLMHQIFEKSRVAGHRLILVPNLLRII